MTYFFIVATVVVISIYAYCKYKEKLERYILSQDWKRHSWRESFPYEGDRIVVVYSHSKLPKRVFDFWEAVKLQKSWDK